MESQEEHKISRMQRIEKMQREKKRTELLYRVGVVVASTLAILVGVVIGVGSAMFSHRNETDRKEEGSAVEEYFAAQAEGEDGDLGTGRKRKSNRRRKEEFDILRASLSIPISGTAVAGEVPVEDVSTQGEVPSDAQEEISELPSGLDSARIPVWAAHETATTMDFGEEVISQYGIMIDIWDGSILSERRHRLSYKCIRYPIFGESLLL